MLKQKQRNINKEILNFPVLEIPLKLDINHPDINNILTYENKQNLIENLKGRLGKAIVKLNTSEIITTVSDDYKLITHKDMIENVEKTLKMSGLEFELFDINEGGKNKNRAYINYLLPTYKFDIEGDIWIPYIQAYSCYDKFLSYGLLTGLYRIENESSFLIFDKKLLASRRHLRGKLELTEDMVEISKWISKLGELRRRIKDWKELKEALDYLELHSSISQVIKIKKHREKFRTLKITHEYIKKFGENYYSLMVSLMEYAVHGLWDEKKRRAYDRSRNAQIQIANIFKLI
jgi:hypothetical protein